MWYDSHLHVKCVFCDDKIYIYHGTGKLIGNGAFVGYCKLGHKTVYDIHLFAYSLKELYDLEHLQDIEDLNRFEKSLSDCDSLATTTAYDPNVNTGIITPG